jgi:hypothetical protein
MRERNIVMAAIVLLVAGSFISDLAGPQKGFTLSGKILTTQQMAPFTLKLYPPLKSGRAILLTTSTNSGEFQFTNVSASSYLLEVYSGKQLVHQQVVELKGDQSVTIDLRKAH